MKNVNVERAHALQQEGYTYIDVRSVPEYDNGHPSGAVNIPLLHYDARLGSMTPNPEFLSVVQRNFQPTDRLLLGCQAGVRSFHAAQLLESVGFLDVVNVEGGFSGGRDQRGSFAAGWVQSGLPVEEQPTPGGSYDELRGNASSD